MLINPKQIKK